MLYRLDRPVDMTHAVLTYDAPTTYRGVGMYGAGAGAREAADERLIEEVRARRAASDASKAKRTVAPARETYTEPTKAIKQQLAEVRAHHRFLTEELKKNETMEAMLLRKADRLKETRRKLQETDMMKRQREKKRQTAFDGKKVALAAKSKGVEKPKKTESKAMKGFRKLMQS
ncbi:hypothetical protein ACET3X_004700 [Alternaria dauci]|uniref:Uncharacterized protein n=1 Tax=Alternaria dauci TaxID=48095 RepID=A0ABR3UJH4_9PLEO